jgi:hypothetical protein
MHIPTSNAGTNSNRTDGRALLKCLGYKDQGYAAGIALPADNYNKELVGDISKSLRRLEIIVFLVNQTHRVTIAVGELPP